MCSSFFVVKGAMTGLLQTRTADYGQVDSAELMNQVLMFEEH